MNVINQRKLKKKQSRLDLPANQDSQFGPTPLDSGLIGYAD